MKLSELSQDQRSHLAWRLDHHTVCGYITAGAVARGDHGDLALVEIFKTYGMCSPRSAQAHARLTANFKVDPGAKLAVETACAHVTRLFQEAHQLSAKNQILLWDSVVAQAKIFKHSAEMLAKIFPDVDAEESKD